MSEIETHCNHTKMEDLVNLIPHPQNPNKHTDKQIALLAKVIKHTGWRSPIVVSKKSGFIVAGHCRLEAAKLLDADKVPIEEQDFKTEAEEFAHLVADNRIAELSNLAADLTLDILQKLKEDDSFDLELSGYTDDEFQALFDVTKPLDYSNDPGDPRGTLEDKKEFFDNTTLRQIVLIYDESEYDEVLGLIGRIRDLAELESNTEAVTAAIRAYKVAS
jgi:hypothetical protein